MPKPTIQQRKAKFLAKKKFSKQIFLEKQNIPIVVKPDGRKGIKISALDLALTIKSSMSGKRCRCEIHNGSDIFIDADFTTPEEAQLNGIITSLKNA